MKLYESLAQEYIDNIQVGKLSAGARLPALRVLAKQHSVSMTTATKAYDYLEEKGWIFAQPQSGFFVSNQALLISQPHQQPQTPMFKTEKRDPRHFLPDMGYGRTTPFSCPLGTAMLAPSLQPKTQLKRAIKRSVSRLSDRMFFYPNIQGELLLRKALSEHFQKDHFSFSAAEITITNGCIDSVRLALESTTKVGDTIAISSPCFNGLLDLLVGLSRNIIEIPNTDQGVDLVLLESHMQDQKIHACLFNTTHMNPSGISLSIEQKQQLALLAEAYQIPIIEDDVYFELPHHGKPALPVKHWDKSGYVIWCGSFSKSLAEGARLGWCLPGRYLAVYLKQQQFTNYGVNYIMQVSMAEFMNAGEYRTHLNKTRFLLSHQIQQYRQLLQDVLPSTARISMPDGGLVLWIQVPNLDTQWLEKKAMEKQIDIRAGSSFSTHPYYRNYFRINCGWPLNETVNESESITAYEKVLALGKLIKECLN